MKSNVNNWMRNTFLRDVSFQLTAMLYFIFAGVNLICSLGLVINNTWIIHVDSTAKSFTTILVALSLLVTLPLVDRIRNRVQFMNKFIFINSVGILILLVNTYINQLFLDLIGRGLCVVSTVFAGILLITILVHESNMLNRGRIAAYLFLLISIVALLILLAIANVVTQILLVIPVLGSIIFIVKYNKYQYIETEVRLTSPVTFRQLATNKQNWGYFICFLIIAFILGIDFPRLAVNLNIILLYVVSILMVIIAGVMIDTVGRKQVMLTMIFLLSIFTIFSAETLQFLTETIVSIIYGVAISQTIVLFIVYSGDTTRDDYRKFRALIVNTYLIGLFIGFALGNLIGTTIMDIYKSDPTTYVTLPDYINKIGAMSIVIILILLHPLKDSLQSSEADWFIYLRKLYVFNNTGVCLYSYDFARDIYNYSRELAEKIGLLKETSLSQDLVSGGLSGIVSLISEITNSNKKLRVVDHEDKKLLFHYEKNTIFCLLTTKDLNILMNKLGEFAQEFEQTYQLALKNFRGSLGVFDDSVYLVDKHFKQKFFQEEEKF
jgi:hypothetical protein